MDRFWHVSKALTSPFLKCWNKSPERLTLSVPLKQPINAGDSARVTLSLWLCLKILGNQHKNLLKTCSNPSSSPIWWLQKWWLHRTYFRVPLLSRRRLGTACGLWSSSNFLAWLEESLDVAFENHHTVRHSKCLWKSVKVLKWWDKIPFLCGSMEFLGRCLIVALNQRWLNQSDPLFFPFCILPMWTSNKNHHV